MKAGRNAEAAAYVERQLARFTNDGPLHLVAARAYAALDKKLLQHKHQGEFYAWQGNLQAAISQFELAVKAKDGDFYQLSVAESRLKAARDELAEQKKSGGGSRPG